MSDKFAYPFAGSWVPKSDDALGASRNDRMAKRIYGHGVYRRLWASRISGIQSDDRFRGRATEVPELDGAIKGAGGNPILFSTGMDISTI